VIRVRPNARDALVLRVTADPPPSNSTKLGRITADDGEVLFAHFSAIEVEGYRALEPGQRITFVWNGGIQDHGRHGAASIRPESS